MGINLFVLLPPRFDVTNKAAISKMVDAVNEEFGGDDNTAKFDWCDVFEGPGGHILTTREAVAFKDEERPYAFIRAPREGSLHWSDLDATSDWRGTLTYLNLPHILFLKARG